MAIEGRRLRFVEEYPIDFNATEAAKRAGYSQKTSYAQGHRLLKDAEISVAIAKRAKAKTDEANVTQADILKMLSDRARASISALTEVHRDSCRFCYGKDHRWQETPAERRSRQDQYDAVAKVCSPKEREALPPFDDLGGVGFDPRKPPNEDCPECFGRGEETVLIKDTRRLTPGEKLAFSGAKRTKEGIEVKATDPFKAIDLLGKYHRLWTDGGSGAPTEKVAVMRITREEAEIAKLKPDPEDYST